MDVQRKDHESSWVGSYLSLYVSWYGTSGVRALLSKLQLCKQYRCWLIITTRLSLISNQCVVIGH